MVEYQNRGDSERQINDPNPEQVGFEYTLAGLGSRTAAFLVDSVIRWFLVLAILAVVGLVYKFLPALDLSAWVKDLSKTWLIALAVLAMALWTWLLSFL